MMSKISMKESFRISVTNLMSMEAWCMRIFKITQFSDIVLSNLLYLHINKIYLKVSKFTLEIM